MLVLFQRDWFGPDGHLYQRSDRIVNDKAFARDVPDEFRAKLPSTAKVLKDGDPVPETHSHVETPVALSELSKAMSPADSLSTRAAEAKSRLEKAQKA